MNLTEVQQNVKFLHDYDLKLMAALCDLKFFAYRICSKYIDMALENLSKKTITSDGDLSLLERVLKEEKNTKIACIMALDMILVGIDTVSVSV